ncbi:hypothetical protein PBPRB1944 [Photobacterium profundum SS9]|uniref:histidine kinase n=1 Tax=Photobacterium profundum (strain SS9) TaxID=298386 RepID=Q6LFY9_PHOPR|nr:hypothetical protein PBPRB1944 [Photobacterium profundum SS9]
MNDYTSYRLEQIGEEWWKLWATGNVKQKQPILDQQLTVIYNLASNNSSLYALKNKAIDHRYQEQYFLQNSRKHLNQLIVQIESNTAKMNRNIDTSISQAQLSLMDNQRLSLLLSIFSVVAAVNSHVRSAQRWLEKQRVDKALINLQKIEVLLDKTATITRHLKAFSRKSDGKMEDVDLANVIQDAIELFESRRNNIVIHYSNPTSYWVRANSIRLEQVLVNLISNAIDAVEHNPAPQIIITVGESLSMVQIIVKDNGAGIPAEDILHIFDPFYTRKVSGKGLGLGLSIAYNIIKDFGGSIRAESIQHQGTKFIVSLQQGTQL